MTEQTEVTQAWPDNMRAPVASNYSGISKSHLAKLRMGVNHGKGPKYAKVAGCIVYRRVDLDEWLEANLVNQST